jgi:hypothetical protein
MTPLTVFLIIALVGALIVIAILASPQQREERERKAIVKAKGTGYRAFMTDAECQLEYKEHKPSVSAAVLSKLKKIQRKYLEGEGIVKFQNLAGVSHHGNYIEGYSLRVRVKVGKNYRVICFTYNKLGKFYSIQDTDLHAKCGYMGEKGDFICSY